MQQLSAAGLQDDVDTYQQLQQAFSAWGPLIPGALVWWASLLLTGALLLARWWQATLYNPGGFSKEFYQLRLGRVLASLLVMLLGGSLLANQVLLANLAMVLGLMFIVQGIALVHALAARAGLARGWLAAFYVIMVLFLSQLLIVLAVIDAWVDFRTRMRANGHS